MDRSGHSLRFCHFLDFYKEAIPDGCRIENARYRWGFEILGDFIKLRFCGPCFYRKFYKKSKIVKFHSDGNTAVLFFFSVLLICIYLSYLSLSGFQVSPLRYSIQV